MVVCDGRLKVLQSEVLWRDANEIGKRKQVELAHQSATIAHQRFGFFE